MSSKKKILILLPLFIVLAGIYWGVGGTPLTLPVTYTYYALCLILSVLYVLVSGGIIWDVIFGTLATLIGALLGRLMRKLPEKLVWLATLPTVISNAIIIPFVLIYAYGVPDAYYYIMLTVGAGELISATLFGTALYYSLKKIKL